MRKVIKREKRKLKTIDYTTHTHIYKYGKLHFTNNETRTIFILNISTCQLSLKKKIFTAIRNE